MSDKETIDNITHLDQMKEWSWEEEPEQETQPAPEPEEQPEPTEEETKPEAKHTTKHSGLIRKITIFTIVVLLVSTVVAVAVMSDGFNTDTLRRWVKYMSMNPDEQQTYSFDSHSSNRYGNFDNGLAVASVSGLNIYDSNGNLRHQVQQQMELPRLICRGNLAVTYDVGGHTLTAVHRRNGKTMQLDEKRPILDADLSAGGYIALSTSESGYKSVLAVYSPNQKLIYRWLSSTTYIPLCAVSGDGKYLAAVGLGQQGGTFESSLYIFKTDSESVQKTVSLGSDLIYDVIFLDKGTICAIGENSAQFFTNQGELLASYSYHGNYLKDFDDNGEGFLALSLNMYKAGNRYTLITVDEKGNELASAYLGQEVLSLSACGKYVAVLTPEGLTIYTPSLSVYHHTEQTGNATSIVMRDDGSVLLLGGGQGKLYIP